MFDFKPLNSKETKKLLKQVESQFGNTFSSNYYYFITPKKRIYIINKDYNRLQNNKLRINNIGLYILTIEKDGIRLSIDGSQLLKPIKNTIKITREQLNLWIKGDDLELNNEDYGYKIVKYNNDFIGTGKLKNKILKNFIPKQRRVVIT